MVLRFDTDTNPIYGNRVKSVLNGVTTYYVGNHFEWTGSTTSMVKYYYADSQRMAMRKGSSTLHFLLGDHLGSTSITANSSGARVAELRYKSWGESRYTYNTTPTSYQFTGQRNDSYIGLYFYNARYYDPSLGRFLQADTIVPNPANPQSLNRYSYTLNNPLIYVDPSGHMYQPAVLYDWSSVTSPLLEFYGPQWDYSAKTQPGEMNIGLGLMNIQVMTQTQIRSCRIQTNLE